MSNGKENGMFWKSLVVIAALTFGGNWNIHNKNSIKTSFPTFLDIINDLTK